MRTPAPKALLAVVAAAGLALAACGSDSAEPVDEPAATADSDAVSATTAETSAPETSAPPTSPPTSPPDDAVDVELPTIVVTTNILGDVVENIVGDTAEVVTIMPVGADPHDFQASAQEVDAMMNADALIVNGAAFEEGLIDVIENAEAGGVPTFEAISAVETLEFGEGGHDHEGDDHDHDGESKDEDHDGDDHDHEHSGADPHFFTDPMRMAAAVAGIAAFIEAEVDIADPAALNAAAQAYGAEIAAVDAEVAAMTETIPVERRVLVTNHEVFGYFADRFGFEVVGAVIPGGSTTDSASAGELAELAELIRSEGVPAIFADTSSSDELAQTLAGEVGDVAVVELYSESLGEPGSDGDTYLGMVRTNGQRITDALA
jgi:zinc/manganese transport system substrate-binding protein